MKHRAVRIYNLVGFDIEVIEKRILFIFPITRYIIVDKRRIPYCYYNREEKKHINACTMKFNNGLRLNEISQRMDKIIAEDPMIV